MRAPVRFGMPVLVLMGVAGGACQSPRGGAHGDWDSRNRESGVAETPPDVAPELPHPLAPDVVLHTVPDAAADAAAVAVLGLHDPPGREPLTAEERDSDPRSEMVTIKVTVDRPKCAHVFWGVKDMGVAPLEIRRPRGSGPMDLVVRCAGALTVHTRVFTDRDDRISIHLFRETEAASVFGYRPPG